MMNMKSGISVQNLHKSKYMITRSFLLKSFIEVSQNAVNIAVETKQKIVSQAEIT